MYFFVVAEFQSIFANIGRVIMVHNIAEFGHGREVHFLVPGTKAANWQELALCEIIRIADPIDRGVYLSFIRAPLYSTIVGGAIGGAVGGIGGAMLRLAAGGVGAIPGAMIGLGVGAAAGVVAGGAVGGVSILTMKEVKDRVMSVRITKLRNARQIKRNSALPDLELPQSYSSNRLRSTSLSVYNRSTLFESSAAHSKRPHSGEFSMKVLDSNLSNPLHEESSFEQSLLLSARWFSAEEPEPYQDPEDPEP